VHFTGIELKLVKDGQSAFVKTFLGLSRFSLENEDEDLPGKFPLHFVEMFQSSIDIFTSKGEAEENSARIKMRVQV
jgi:hypothetical protein